MQSITSYILITSPNTVLTSSSMILVSMNFILSVKLLQWTWLWCPSTELTGDNAVAAAYLLTSHSTFYLLCKEAKSEKKASDSLQLTDILIITPESWA